jgi:hypothetical protein
MRRVALAIVAALALLGAVLFQSNPLTQRAQDYARSVAVASGGVYLTLRSLNALLSTAQEVEVGGSFVVQGTAQPFKVLEPVDDTIERIASMVFTVMVVTGVLAVALGPASALGYGMLAGAAVLGLMVRHGGAGRAGILARRLGWYGVFLGLALPGAFLLSSLLADWMTADVMAKHQAILAELTADVDPRIETPGSGGILDWIGGTRDQLERYAALAGNIYERADELISSLVAITAVFVFKLLILPALILGGLFVIIRFFAHLDPQ